MGLLFLMLDTINTFNSHEGFGALILTNRQYFIIEVVSSRETFDIRESLFMMNVKVHKYMIRTSKLKERLFVTVIPHT